MKLRHLLFALITIGGLRAASDLPVFNATLTVGREHRFVLVSPAGKTSEFIRLGDTFEGYKLKAYDTKTSTLDVERDGKISHLTLAADAAVTNAPLAPTPATIADAAAVMNKIQIDVLLERTVVQQKKMFATQIESIGKNFPNADKADVEDLQKKMMTEFEKVLDVGKMKGDITRIYSETFSKEELNQISAFYDTPLGQVLLAKQPEVQQKMQASLVPRMAELGPKIQTMARDFAMEQKAKMQGGAAPAPAPKP
ncbi:MAG: DUF2059 domain-containing protein [Verrucomicrobia bacterium]|nr:DUF2059 domain-containing protein [Verrucomicrobiota bacterium]